MTTVITGIGWVTANSMGRGRGPGRFALSPGKVPRLTRREALKNRQYPRFGRMDSFSRMGLAAVARAIEDAGLEPWTGKRDMGIIAGTTYGCLTTDFDYYQTVIPKDGLLASPNLFTYTLPNCFLGDAAICFGMTGPSFIINEPSAFGLGPIRSALDLILLGDCDMMLAGMCELGYPEMLEGLGPVLPGAVFMVLEASQRPGVEPLARLTTDHRNRIFVDTSEVKDLVGCVQHCIASAKGH